MERDELADFLRRRREVLTPADVGISLGVRRRTPGLRRDEVALLAGMSTDYYTRLEQRRGPHPSTQILSSLARALRLDDDERDHLYILAGQSPPTRVGADKHVGPGLMHLLTKLDDTPACVVTDLGEILAHNEMYVALCGGPPVYSGLDRYIVWRWFTHPSARTLFPEDDWKRLGHKHVADLRAVSARRAGDAEVATLVDRLRADSQEFEDIWSEHRVAFKTSAVKRFVHADVGLVSVHCETLVTQKQGQHLLVYTPLPGTDARAKFDLLRVIGTQSMRATVEQ
ncbi:helix-turn-helix transcriptional regulator [Rhodococcus sp. G-MC3]|uniref:helix-turn-helix transcriptional regulator n=1 Tax=Rhodococcus sp. G-MC3 TaxID=3046209 RepID=UPI0024BA121E|nr:helix-turn-helix transcriptional regulator [Rhodococcus sp. G-MC3]MDJ0392194.1 helix-turn-helix transcriptional regulator [Rhodococcus sp. G-MC3]